MSAPTPRRVESSPFDAYLVRVMLGLVASLSLVLMLVHLPLQSPVERVGWSANPPAEGIVVEEVREEPEEAEQGTEAAPVKKRTLASAPPTTDRRSSASEAPSTADTGTSSGSTASTGTASSSQDSGRARQYEKVQSITELGITDRTPHIVGGVGSLYLHINYPQEALRQGIEGQLALEFTVQRDGSVADLEVVESLHPLCDSAAVEGVRSVEFIPAKRDGEPIPIRLHLPVKFQLTATTSSTLPKGRNP